MRDNFHKVSQCDGIELQRNLESRQTMKRLFSIDSITTQAFPARIDNLPDHFEDELDDAYDDYEERSPLERRDGVVIAGGPLPVPFSLGPGPLMPSASDDSSSKAASNGVGSAGATAANDGEHSFAIRQSIREGIRAGLQHGLQEALGHDATLGGDGAHRLDLVTDDQVHRIETCIGEPIMQTLVACIKQDEDGNGVSANESSQAATAATAQAVHDCVPHDHLAHIQTCVEHEELLRVKEDLRIVEALYSEEQLMRAEEHHRHATGAGNGASDGSSKHKVAALFQDGVSDHSGSPQAQAQAQAQSGSPSTSVAAMGANAGVSQDGSGQVVNPGDASASANVSVATPTDPTAAATMPSTAGVPISVTNTTSTPPDVPMPGDGDAMSSSASPANTTASHGEGVNNLMTADASQSEMTPNADSMGGGLNATAATGLANANNASTSASLDSPTSVVEPSDSAAGNSTDLSSANATVSSPPTATDGVALGSNSDDSVSNATASLLPQDAPVATRGSSNNATAENATAPPLAKRKYGYGPNWQTEPGARRTHPLPRRRR